MASLVGIIWNRTTLFSCICACCMCMCSLVWFVFELHFGLELLTWGEGIKGVATVVLLNLVGGPARL